MIMDLATISKTDIYKKHVDIIGIIIKIGDGYNRKVSIRLR